MPGWHSRTSLCDEGQGELALSLICLVVAYKRDRCLSLIYNFLQPVEEGRVCPEVMRVGKLNRCSSGGSGLTFPGLYSRTNPGGLSMGEPPVRQ